MSENMIAPVTAVAPPPPAVPGRRAHIGSYVLETLTVGMYGEPRHAIREYVQNAYDSIRRARKSRWLAPGDGLVTITLDDVAGTLTLEDDGTGISSASAWGVLSSVGASSKDRRQQAGFRGIGRLAGIAYCDQLRFITKFAGELDETTVTFDCVRLRNAMDPDRSEGEDIQNLLAEAVTDQPRRVQDDEKDLHYMRVVLDGLSSAPLEITDIGLLRTYLVQTSPADFGKDWPFADQIRGFAAAAGQPLDPIRIELIHTTGPATDGVAKAPDAEPVDEEGPDVAVAATGRSTKYEILKPYSSLLKPAGRTAVKVQEVIPITDDASPPKWWGWIGRHQVLGMLVEEEVRGLRVRVRDIQIDGTAITDEMFSDVRPTYARFNKWHIGEIHIVSTDAIPNARRDGFEENATWEAIQQELTPTLKDLASKTYKASNRRSTIRKIATGVEEYLARASEALGPNLTEEEQQDLISQAKKVSAGIADADIQDMISAEEAQTLTELSARVNTVRRRIEDVEVRGPGSPPVSISPSELLTTVYEVLTDLLDPSLYRRVRRRIEDELERQQP